MKTYLIPFGFRCNAAIVTNAIVDQPRFVFDWTQMNIHSMIHVLNLEPSGMQTFWTQYFSKLDNENRHTETSSWFPHDKFTTEEEKVATLNKYIRRTERLYNLMKTDSHVIFLIFNGFPEIDSLDKSHFIINALLAKKSSNVSFIVCNSCFLNQEVMNLNLIYEPLLESNTTADNDWNDLTSRITTRVKTLLAEKDIQISPFLSDES
jgi:hypothetical protein